jgi:hypothetical protein
LEISPTLKHVIHRGGNPLHFLKLKDIDSGIFDAKKLKVALVGKQFVPSSDGTESNLTLTSHQTIEAKSVPNIRHTSALPGPAQQYLARYISANQLGGMQACRPSRQAYRSFDHREHTQFLRRVHKANEFMFKATD